jgi:hypothetical protein
MEDANPLNPVSDRSPPLKAMVEGITSRPRLPSTDALGAVRLERAGDAARLGRYDDLDHPIAGDNDLSLPRTDDRHRSGIGRGKTMGG